MSLIRTGSHNHTCSTWAVRSRSVSSNHHEPPVKVHQWERGSETSRRHHHHSLTAPVIQDKPSTSCCLHPNMHENRLRFMTWDQFTTTQCRFVSTKHFCGEVLLLLDISLPKKCNTWKMSWDLWVLRDFSDHRHMKQLKQLQKLSSKSKIQSHTEAKTKSQIWNIVPRTDWFNKEENRKWRHHRRTKKTKQHPAQ